MPQNKPDNKIKAEIAKYRENLVEVSFKSQESFDKAILTLSAGGIGFTFSFLDKIVPFATAGWRNCLMLVWIYWAGSMTSTLISFTFSNKAFVWEIKKLDGEINQLDPREKTFDAKLGEFCAHHVGTLNAGSLFMFLSGMIFLMIFLWHNFQTCVNNPSHEN